MAHVHSAGGRRKEIKSHDRGEKWYRGGGKGGMTIGNGDGERKGSMGTNLDPAIPDKGGGETVEFPLY